MPQSLARLDVHLIFSTKHRRPLIGDDVRDSLHAYMATVLRNAGCLVEIVNSVDDHVHVLFALGRTVSLASAVEEVKKTSSRWMKTHGQSRGEGLADFAWQAGYGAFAVSASKRGQVRTYIAGQREHHREVTFQEEYRAFLERHGLAFDERYVWD